MAAILHTASPRWDTWLRGNRAEAIEVTASTPIGNTSADNLECGGYCEGSASTQGNSIIAPIALNAVGLQERSSPQIVRYDVVLGSRVADYYPASKVDQAGTEGNLRTEPLLRHKPIRDY